MRATTLKLGPVAVPTQHLEASGLDQGEAPGGDLGPATLLSPVVVDVVDVQEDVLRLAAAGAGAAEEVEHRLSQRPALPGRPLPPALDAGHGLLRRELGVGLHEAAAGALPHRYLFVQAGYGSAYGSGAWFASPFVSSRHCWIWDFAAEDISRSPMATA